VTEADDPIRAAARPAGPPDERPLNDWAVAGVLAERPAHGFDVARVLGRDGPLGLVWTVRRQQVYRALDHLSAQDAARPLREEPGRGGPPRTVYALTDTGRAEVDRWLDRPVGRLREVRHALLLKLALLERRDRDPGPLLRAQRREATAMRAACEAATPVDPAARLVTAWRRESAEALLRLLDALER
jgi:PadR family transcriptional regulator AphA